MAATPRLQVSSYRFLRRRTEDALLGADLSVARPARAQSLAAGCLTAALVAAGCGMLAVVRPQPGLDGVPIVMGAHSGALYVRVGETLHPVLNLASARLIAQTDAAPRAVGEADIGRATRGPMLGIPGAPGVLLPPLPAEEAVWTVCDSGSVASTSVLIGPIQPPSESTMLDAPHTALVTADSGKSTYLIHGGHRSLVSLADPAAVRALHLEGIAPHPVSRLLLDALAEATPIVAPLIPGAGRPSRLPRIPTGAVVRVPTAAGDEYDVVLSDGVQRVGQVTADLIRLADTRGGREVISVAPDSLRSSPTVNPLPITGFPDQSVPVDLSALTVLCVTWRHPSVGRTEITTQAGTELPVPAGQAPTALAQADGSGPLLDAVYLPPGHSAYARAVDAPYLITDTGVRFAVRGDDAARSLGLPDAATPAPWPVLAALPQGPELSRQRALLARDVVDRPAGRPSKPGTG